jgi:hypothetical protein
MRQTAHRKHPETFAVGFFLGLQARRFYHGDNKNPGHELHETRRRGNLILRIAFEDLHHGHRKRIPPFFIFTKGAIGRDVIFRGLAVPGAISIPQTEDLVAIWRTKSGQRFQNYRAILTILDVPRILRVWLNEIKTGNRLSEHAPEPWSKTGQGLDRGADHCVGSVGGRQAAGSHIVFGFELDSGFGVILQPAA